MIKRFLLFVLLTAAVWTVGCNPCMVTDLIRGGDRTPTDDFLSDFKQQDKSIRQLVSISTGTFLLGAGRLFGVAGMVDKALYVHQAAEKILEESQDLRLLQDTLSMVGADVIPAMGPLPEALEKIEKTSEIQEKLRQGIIEVGSAQLLHEKAGRMADEFLGLLDSAVEEVKRDPIKYGICAITLLNPSLNAMVFLAGMVPDQAVDIGNITKDLMKIGEARGIKICDEDFEKASDELEKDMLMDR